MKRCNTCGLTKPLTEFWRRAVTSDGRDSRCAACARARWRDRAQAAPEDPLAVARAHRAHPEYDDYRRHHNYKTRYGITLEQYEAMYATRGGLCDVCKEWFPKLCVDHCHQSRIIRGLLCTSCNVSIGRMNDDAERLRNAARYVERFSQALSEAA